MERSKQSYRVANCSRGLRVMLAAVVVASSVISAAFLPGGVPARADDSLSCTVDVWGSQWLGGQGVNVCRNVYGYDYSHLNVVNGTYVGIEWQCVELAQRLYFVKGWYGAGGFGVPYAKDIWTANLGLMRQANGSIGSIAPGDMIIISGSSAYPAGHVVVVDSVSGSTVNIVEENHGGAGRGTFTWSGGWLWRSDGTDSRAALGVIHSPNNQLGGAPTSTPTRTPVPVSTPTPQPTLTASSSHSYWFTWYDSKTATDALLITNPAENGRTATAQVQIGTVGHMPVVRTYNIGPGQTIAQSYPGVQAGPVHVVSVGGLPLVTSQRLMYQGHFAEVPGLPDSRMASRYVYPWYDSAISNGHDYVLAYNPSATMVWLWMSVAGNVYEQPLGPGAMVTPHFGEAPAWLKGGPVQVWATSGPDGGSPMPLLTSQRVQTNAISEVWGTPADGLSAANWFTWFDAYDTQNADWIMAANPSNTAVTYTISVGQAGQAGYASYSGSLGPAQSASALQFRQFPGVKTGPVQVTSSAPIVTSQRSLWGGPGGSFGEMAGASQADLGGTVYFPYYDGRGTQGRDWIMVANPNAYAVTVSASLPGQATQSATVAPRGHWFASFGTATGGPVQVKATAGGNPAPILASQRTLWANGVNFNEVLGLAYPQ